MKKQTKRGRPSEYNQEKADFICKMISITSWGLPKICQYFKESHNLPHECTIREWRLEIEEFSTKYARAKQIQGDLLAEECVEISDNSTPLTVNVDRLRIDTRKWIASKLLPKQYGDIRELEQKTEENERLREELLELRARLDERNKREF